MASPGKLQEAEKLIAEAEKSLKTSLLKWSPDYATAASRYEKAAICYRNSRQHQKAKEAYMNAADAHYNNNAVYHSAKSLEQAAHVCRDAKELLEAGRLMQQSCERFNESGHPDTGGQVLSKGAQWLQHDVPDKAAEYFLMVSEYLILDDKFRESANATKDAVRMYCRTRPRQLDKVISSSKIAREALIRAQMINVAHELASVEVIALLLQGNSMQARESLQESEKQLVGFANSEDYTALDNLIEAVSSNDTEDIAQCCSSGVFRAMDPEFSKLVQDLKTGKESVATTGRAKISTGATVDPSVKPKDITKNTPATLASMRNELFATKKSSQSSSKKKVVVDESPPPSPKEQSEANEESIDEDDITVDIN